MTTTTIRHEVVVSTTQDRAFTTFVERINEWWPSDHSINTVARADVVIEPRVGGSVYEVGEDGSRCRWGQVLTWDPPGRLTVAWMISPACQFEPDLSKASEYTVELVPTSDAETRVTLVHSHLDRHGEGGDQLRAAVDGPGGRPQLMANLAAIVAETTSG